MGWMGRQEKPQYGVCVCVWTFAIRSLTHSMLEEYGHPVAVAVEVGMAVYNPLVHNVYTTHPVVAVIDEG
eukprot:7002520-Ditylum_brightwellii.AAC.1